MIQKISSTKWLYSSIPPTKWKAEKFIIKLRTSVHGETLQALPCPLYKLELPLTVEEYEKLRKLTRETGIPDASSQNIDSIISLRKR